ncbi:secretin N-terminal domain-containing protein [Azohydromonas lata]|uniref:Secretin N-terminal domain-containing protein n=1 Tax=Azohydromonas lata TaxID=45677 RepID=A0ABU5IDX3_9BURK|nr:secretin N-terminal domain-containing protein [Azohydromonas lata]MDZ5457029.1 secretin N-terminal domain-containing protein [Azohydromonas lata]
MKTCAFLAAAVLLGGCASPQSARDPSAQQRIDETLRQAAQPRPAPAPELPPAVSQSLLPPLRGTLPRGAVPQAEPRFDLVVSDAPISQVLHAIASDSRWSILLSPRAGLPAAPVSGAQGEAAAAASRRELLTVHLKNVTVFEALDSIRETYGYEYSVSGTRIVVEPPELQTRFYIVNYTLGQRRGVSDIQVVAGAATGGGGGSSGSGGSGGGSSSSGGSGGSGGNGGGAASYGSTQASALSTISKSDFWGELEDSMRTILACQIPKLGPSGARAGAAGSGGSAAVASSRADVSYLGDAPTGERLRGVEGCGDGRAVSVNQMSGTVLVRGMPKELRTVERLLRAMQLTVERQVIIEAKVIDVQLNKDSQQGINWAAFRDGLVRGGVGANTALVGATGTPAAGRVATGATLADFLGGQMLDGMGTSAFTAGVGLALRGSQFAALINFLETQGDVHVLSSPRIATLNNQKAVIKVGTEEPFITAIQPGSTSLASSAAVSVPPTLTYQPFFSGISLDVTPQIDERDRVTLHVHALVNAITEKLKPSSTQAGSAAVPLAVSSVNETDSVVKTVDGTMVVIGGLMTESSNNTRSAIPGAGDVPLAGALFRKAEQASSKRELVILIKPTVVKMEADWAEDIAAASRRIQDMDSRMRTD